jgi:nicotinate (nicotinamide) nucleotide adenylyltransferase
VYELLKQKLFSGEYQLGEQLNETQIAKDLQVSRAPVREALSLLAGDGMVSIVPGKGAFVRNFTAKDVENMAEVRSVFQKAGTYNLRNRSKSHLESLRKIRAAMTAAFESGDFNAYSNADSDLHVLVGAAVNNEMMLQMAEQQYGMLRMVSNITLRNEARYKETYQEHLGIIDALLAGDYDRAWEITEAHIAHTMLDVSRRLYAKDPRLSGKVGIFGGAFDPVHSGHLRLGKLMLKELGLDRILFVPSYKPVHKIQTITASFEDRLEMCRLAVGEDPRFLVEDIENSLYCTGYFWDVLRRYVGIIDEIHLILGPDAFLSLLGWKNSEYIVQNAMICTAAERERPDLAACKERIESMGGRAVILESPLLPVSSTKIRVDLEGNKEFLPPPVYEYIKNLGIY